MRKQKNFASTRKFHIIIFMNRKLENIYKYIPAKSIISSCDAADNACSYSSPKSIAICSSASCSLIG